MKYTVADLATGRPPLGWKPDRGPRMPSTLEWARYQELGVSMGHLVEVPDAGPHGLPELRFTEEGAWFFGLEDDAQ
jgi:hypothetical protein